MQVDTIIRAAWVIPVEPAEQVLEDHCVVISNGKIVAVIPSAQAQAYHASHTYDLPNHALIPGLINAHTHAAMNLMRGLADDKPLMQWLEQDIWPVEQQWVDANFVGDGTRHAIAEMLLGGTTCFNDMYYFPDRAATIAREIGMRAVIGLIVLDFPTAWASDTTDYLVKAAQVHDSVKDDSLITTAFAPHAPYTVSDESLGRVRTIAEELGLPIVIHLHETVAEVNESFAQYGARPIQRLQQLGMLSPELVAVHMTQLNAAEIDEVQRHGVNIVHCPQSNLKLASGFCPVHELQQAGVNVAIGTDGAASNNKLDMFEETRAAALLGKGFSDDPSAVPAASALQMATLNGAKALALDDRVGSLVVGKEADIVAVDLGGLTTQPVYDPISQLVYASQRADVTEVWVQGELKVSSGQLTNLVVQEILDSVHRWRDRISTTGKT